MKCSYHYWGLGWFNNLNGVKVTKTLKPDSQLVQQKAKSKPVHSQEPARKDQNYLRKEGNLDKLERLTEFTFVLPAVITVEE